MYFRFLDDVFFTRWGRINQMTLFGRVQEVAAPVLSRAAPRGEKSPVLDCTVLQVKQPNKIK